MPWAWVRPLALVAVELGVGPGEGDDGLHDSVGELNGHGVSWVGG